MEWIRRHERDERGASLVEYALLVALIAIVCVVSIQFFGSAVGGNLSRSGSSIVGP
jgi:pilus assembly protein Flp/PilA